MPSSVTKKRKRSTPAASTSTGKVRMVKKQATGVLSVPPVSIKSSNMSIVAEIQDIRGRLTKVERQAIEIMTHLEALSQRLEQLEARERQRTATSRFPRPSCGRRLFGAADSDEGNAGLSPAFLPATPACPHCSNSRNSTQLPDVPLRPLTAEREETFYKEYSQRGERRPDVYAASFFMALCPFEAYQSWAKQVGQTAKPNCPKI